MVAGKIYKVSDPLPDIASEYYLAIESPDENGVVDTLIYCKGIESAKSDAVHVIPEECDSGSVVTSRTYPLHVSRLTEQMGVLLVKDMELVSRALVRKAVNRYFPYGHPSKEFEAGVSAVPVSGKVYGEAEMGLLVDASLDFWLTTGRFNKAFEDRFGEFSGAKHVLTTNSGSSANLLAVSALTSPKLGERALRPGDEVITVAAGFPTTVNPIIQNGMVPVFCDVSLATCNILPEELEKAFSSRTRAVVLAHTLGNPFDLRAVTAFCRKHDLWLVEDCCDALGAQYADEDGILRPVGSFGDIATYSFYPAHHITMGEGGAVTTNSASLKKIIESFRDWGRDCWCPPGCDNTCGCRYEWKLGELPQGYDHKYMYSHVGYNLKITDMQAAVALAQMDRLDGFIAARQENFAFLKDAFADMDDIFVLPEPAENSVPSFFGFPVTIRPEAKLNREALLKHLEEARIGTRLLFGGNIVKQPYMRAVEFRQIGKLENTDTIMRHTFWLGVYPGLTRPMLEYIVETVRSFVRRSC